MTTLRVKSPEPTERAVTLRSMLPIISASTLGTSIEWYDFFFYGFLAVTVFPTVFFPQSAPFIGILGSVSTSFIGFVARPVGGAFFGWFGDRIGRKATLVATLLLMGCSTMLMGVLPGYAALGIAAPLLLSGLRFLQGIAVGGEWGGSVLLSMEYGDDRRRGFWTGWPQTGVPIGLALSALVVLVYKGLFPGDAFDNFGWRIPFFQSSVLLIVGLYIRLRLMETPIFTSIKKEQRISNAPVLEAIRYYWREILLCMLLRSSETGPFYIFTTFVLSYAVQIARVNTTLLYTGLTLASLLALVLMPLSSHISDRLGRKRWFMWGTGLMAAFAFPYFLLLQSGNVALILFALIFSVGVCNAWLYGPEAAFIAEQFGPRLRYSGASLGYQLASVTAGGAAPIIATYVLQNYKTIGGGVVAGAPSYLLIALYIFLTAIISCLAAYFLRDYTGRPAAQDRVEGR